MTHWKKCLHRLAMIATASAMLAGIPRMANAQTAVPTGPPTVQPPDHDTTRAELRKFDGFLDNHPEVAEQLRKNPNLVNNPKYIAKHPQLHDFLEDHPRVREEVKENPRAFMNRERHFEKTENKPHRAAAPHR